MLHDTFIGLPIVSATDVTESYHAYTKPTSKKKKKKTIPPVFALQEVEEACSVSNCGELPSTSGRLNM